MFSSVLRRSVATQAARCNTPKTARLMSTSAKPALSGRNAAAAAAATGVLAMLLLGTGASAAPTTTEASAPAVAATEGNTTIVLGVDDERVESMEQRLTRLEREFAVMAASAKNQAFVFIKPHAVTDKVLAVVSEGLGKAGITIKSEGTLDHSVIDEKSLIDTHYGAIASKATKLKPEEQNVSSKGQEDFNKMFGEEWTAAIEAGKVYNAKDACAKLGIDGAELDSKWSELTRGKDLLKFGGGHYVGKVGDIFIINGFFMSMRDKYCRAPAKIHYYVVEWDPSQLSWEDFRGKVLGGTDPVEASAGSLRREIFDSWKDLGLEAQPDVGDNGVHASASPFEAMAERVNWTGADVETDLFGKAALSLGISKEELAVWMADAQVTVEGKKQSIFDFLEDQNSAENLERLAAVLAEKST